MLLAPAIAQPINLYGSAVGLPSLCKERSKAPADLFYNVAQMSEHLGEFEQIVLLAILRLGDGAYGVPIRNEIEQRAARRVSVGALYSTLDRLEGKKYIYSWFADATPQRGGRSKRYFRVLPKGVEALTRSKSMLERMWHGVKLKGVSHV